MELSKYLETFELVGRQLGWPLSKLERMLSWFKKKYLSEGDGFARDVLSRYKSKLPKDVKEQLSKEEQDKLYDALVSSEIGRGVDEEALRDIGY